MGARVYLEDETGAVSAEILEIISAVAGEALAGEGLEVDYEIGVTIAAPEAIRELNKEHRGIDRATDVLSFPMLEPEEIGGAFSGGIPLLGDIVICYDQAVAQAVEYGHGIGREMGFLTAHSMLHLLGYDHTDAESEGEMIRKQEEILGRLGLTRPGDNP